MNSIQKTLFIIFYKSYKLIKHILYKIFIFPFQYFIWRSANFYYYNLKGYKKFYKKVYKEKIIVYITMICLFVFFFKYTQFLLYDPLIFEVEIKWPRNINILRKRALVHWINLAICYTFMHIWGWIFYRVHNHYKDWAGDMYWDMWFWFHIWFHGIWWDTLQEYMIVGAGQLAIFTFAVIHIWFYMPHQFLETFEDMEYDWDDLPEEREGTEYDDIDMAVGEEGKRLFDNAHQTILDEITWDVFGNLEDRGDDPDKSNLRWDLWMNSVYPPFMTTLEWRWEDSWETLELDEIWNVWDYYVANFSDSPEFVTPELEEDWWVYWTEEHHGFTMQYIVFPYGGPIRRFYYKTFRSFFAFLIPLRRVRAVGEYDRFNWRYKNWLLKFSDIPEYRGIGEVGGKDFIAIVTHIAYTLYALLLAIKRRYDIYDTWDGIKDRLFSKKFKKQVKKLRKWGSINYSFFGKKNYKPKK